MKFFQYSPAADSVILIGRSHLGGQQPATRIDDGLALAALDFFVAVKALVQYAALAALDGLRVHDGYARAGLARRRRLPAVLFH